jgi:hypothetical protein
MKKIPSSVLLAAVIFFILTQALTAQTKNSVYSMFGIGQLIDDSYGINKSFGGTGIAFQSGKFINFMNPASYLGILPNSFMMELGAYGILSKSASAKLSQRDGIINANYFSASLYLKNWWAFSAGIVPYSYINFETHTTDQIGGELVSLDKTFTGTGGLTRVYLGNSFKINNRLAVGFNASYIGGPITQTETAASTGSFAGYEIKHERSTYCFSLDYGLQYCTNVQQWLCTIGLIYGPGKKLSTIEDTEFTYDGTTTSLEQDEYWDIKIPRKFGLGIAAKKGSKLRAGFDYEWRNWANIQFTNTHINARNSNRFSAGMEYSPGSKNKWLKSLSYRLGANYKNSYLEINNTPINSLAMNLGLGFAHNPVSNFILTLEYGKEGTLDKKLIKNSYWAFYVNYSLHDFWLKRQSR